MSGLYDIPLEHIEGTPGSLGEFAGQVLLVVNVASRCRFTPQYAELEALYEAQRGRGLTVVGFPANDFGAQEPGSNHEIAAFCSTTYNVRFPLFAKIAITGADQHPLYRELIAAQPAATKKPGTDLRGELASFGVTQAESSDVMWNFEKFLIARDGRVVARFAADVAPDDALLLEAIERELARPSA